MPVISALCGIINFRILPLDDDEAPSTMQEAA